jgi:group I intron endonuclease
VRQQGGYGRGFACIYVIDTSTSRRVYVGSTKCFNQRFSQHQRRLKNGTHHCKHLQYAYNKHGASTFEMRVVEPVSNTADLITREQMWIDTLARKGLYNAAQHASRTVKMKPIVSFDTKTGKRCVYASAESAAMQIGKPLLFSDRIRRAARRTSVCAGAYWSWNLVETFECITQKLRMRRDNRSHSKARTVFVFAKNGDLIAKYESITKASRMCEVSPSEVSACCVSDSFRTAKGMHFSFTDTRSFVGSRKTKKVIQKQHGIVLAVWMSAVEASRFVAGTTIKGISSAATGYTKSHRGYQWEFAKS